MPRVTKLLGNPVTQAAKISRLRRWRWPPPGPGPAALRLLGRTVITMVAVRYSGLYLASMKLAEIEQEALALPERERASLVAKLLDTLPPPGTDISEEEVEQRERELEAGSVAAISHDEFVRRVERERGR